MGGNGVSYVAGGGGCSDLLPVEQSIGEYFARDVCPLPSDGPVRVDHVRQGHLSKNRNTYQHAAVNTDTDTDSSTQTAVPSEDDRGEKRKEKTKDRRAER